MAKESAKEFLVDWTVTYIKSRDAISKSIEDIKTSMDNADILVSYKGYKLAIIVEPFLKDTGFLDKLKKFREKGIKTRLVTANSRENLKLIIDNWKTVSGFDREFNIIFANPFSNLEKKWIIYPQTHAGISGRGFQRGLKALFATVESITEKEFESRL